jgi:pyoverdine/dityrosine biosynthesis protein Dit1
MVIVSDGHVFSDLGKSRDFESMLKRQVGTDDHTVDNYNEHLVRMGKHIHAAGTALSFTGLHQLLRLDWCPPITRHDDSIANKSLLRTVKTDEAELGRRALIRYFGEDPETLYLRTKQNPALLALCRG